MKINTLEKGLRNRELVPTIKIEDKLGTIYIAETDLQFDKDHPLGFYQYAWAVSNKASKGKMDVMNWVEFNGNHDQNFDSSTRRKMRINAAVEEARKFLKISKEIGRFDG